MKFALLFVAGLILPLSLNDIDRPLVLMQEARVESRLAGEKKHAISGSIAESFSRIGLRAKDIHELLSVAKPVYDLNRVHPSMTYQYRGQPATEISLNLSPFRSLVFSKETDGWKVEDERKTIETRYRDFQGVVRSSLWESASHVDSKIVILLSELFAWQIDFAREVRRGDKWRVVIEENYVDGEFVGWGSILSAEYVNNGRRFDAYRFEIDGQHIGYFDRSGQSLQKLFLKSPLKYGRISSRFSRRRFHPIRKVYRPHLGVDYAAPIGTPVRAVGDGVISFRGRKGGAGKMIRIRHNGIYKSAYLHLNGYARGIRKGSRVKQGQVIGYVGKTGLATGPHLHYEFYKYGQYVDPLAVEFPSADPIDPMQKPIFQKQVQSLAGLLPNWDVQVAQLED